MGRLAARGLLLRHLQNYRAWQYQGGSVQATPQKGLASVSSSDARERPWWSCCSNLPAKEAASETRRLVEKHGDWTSCAVKGNRSRSGPEQRESSDPLGWQSVWCLRPWAVRYLAACHTESISDGAFGLECRAGPVFEQLHFPRIEKGKTVCSSRIGGVAEVVVEVVG